ncbi:hypothetical protein CesoFtcFv8_026534 [Champsocephalus esox]|uniref:Uncharacterized protein n=1 Tax=Champsocephalus esox TaxID=159716 RepID=A0AAN8G8G0_9TELE|nr:hypothetical protein CesoFtcFv8_026534 [Champsocephalus esox]
MRAASRACCFPVFRRRRRSSGFPRPLDEFVRDYFLRGDYSEKKVSFVSFCPANVLLGGSSFTSFTSFTSFASFAFRLSPELLQTLSKQRRNGSGS